jgi:hypothetical protein
MNNLLATFDERTDDFLADRQLLDCIRLLIIQVDVLNLKIKDLEAKIQHQDPAYRHQRGY